MISKSRAHLVLLVVIWAVSWPAIKVGVATVPPLWYAFLRYAIAAGCLFAFAAWRREIVVPPRADWTLVAVSGVLQMAAYSGLTAAALTVLPPGRASVLAYSTPLWVAPLSAWYLRERIAWPGMAGVALGSAGVAMIAAPSLQDASDAQLAACGMLIAAAAAWAVSIVFVRAHRFTTSALALAPWQMLVAALLLLPIAMGLEGRLPGIGASAAASLAYVAPVATAFAYWAIVETGRQQRPDTIAMALLGVPALGTLISALTLGEAIDLPLAAGIGAVGIGIRLAIRAADAKPC